MAIDFMSSYVDYRTQEAFHYEPERLFALAKKLTKRVCLRHDYPLFEFCLYLYPNFQRWAPRDQAFRTGTAPGRPDRDQAGPTRDQAGQR